VCKFIEVVFSFYQSELLKLLNKSLIDFFGMVMMKVMLELKFLGVCFLCQKKRGGGGLGIKKLEEWNGGLP
jgi:hypothetical protein